MPTVSRSTMEMSEFEEEVHPHDVLDDCYQFDDVMVIGRIGDEFFLRGSPGSFKLAIDMIQYGLDELCFPMIEDV